MSSFDEVLGGLPTLGPGYRVGGTDSAALDEWEQISGHQLPVAYRDFAVRWAGNFFAQPQPCFLLAHSGEYELFEGWLHVAGPSFVTDRSTYDPSLTVEYATRQVRERMDYETCGLASAWGDGIVVFGSLVVNHSWVAFDFAYNPTDPAVVIYNNGSQWTDTLPTVDFVAPDFASFLELLEPTDYEVIDQGAPRSQTEASIAWQEHAKAQLGGRTRDQAVQEILRRQALNRG